MRKTLANVLTCITVGVLSLVLFNVNDAQASILDSYPVLYTYPQVSSLCTLLPLTDMQSLNIGSHPIVTEYWSGTESSPGSQYVVVYNTDGSYNTTQTANQTSHQSYMWCDYSYSVTRIISLTPTTGAVLSSTSPVTFSFSAYVAPQNVGQRFDLRIDAGNSFCDMVISYNSILCPNQDNHHFLYEVYATTSGILSFSATSLVNLAVGTYIESVDLRSNCFLGFCASYAQDINGYNIGSITNWAVVKNSRLGNDFIAVTSQVNDYLYGDATSTPIGSSCNPFSFAIGPCIYSMLLPDSGQVRILLDQSSRVFLLGYVFDFIKILAYTGTSSLPVIDITVPIALPFGGAHIRLDPTHAIDYIWNATAEPYGTSTASYLDTIEYYWEIIVYICAGWYIFRRIVGAQLFGSPFTTTESATTSISEQAYTKNGMKKRISRSITKRRKL